MKQPIEIDIPDGYEVHNVLYQNKINTGGEIIIILKSKQTKDFSFYIDQYLDTGGSSTSDEITNWLETHQAESLKNKLKTKQLSLVPWEIKMGLFKFICESEGQSWKIQTEMGLYSKTSAIKTLPQEFIDDLFKNKN